MGPLLHDIFEVLHCSIHDLKRAKNFISKNNLIPTITIEHHAIKPLVINP